MRAGYQRWRDLLTTDLLPALATQQVALVQQMTALQQAVAQQVVQGLFETLGMTARLTDDLDGVALVLDDDVHLGFVVESINLEGAWSEVRGEQVVLLVQPWFSAEEIDQTILSAVKVLHVLLGIHPPDLDVEAHLLSATACHWEAPPQAEPEAKLTGDAGELPPTK